MTQPSSLRIFINNHPFIHSLVIRWLRWKALRSPCVFCQIVRGGAPERILFQDDLVTTFRDAHPATSTHILIVPNRHIASLDGLTEEDQILAERMFVVARQHASLEKIDHSGYRLTINTGLHAGQTVFHLHMHLQNMGVE